MKTIFIDNMWSGNGAPLQQYSKKYHIAYKHFNEDMCGIFRKYNYFTHAKMCISGMLISDTPTYQDIIYRTMDLDDNNQKGITRSKFILGFHCTTIQNFVGGLLQIPILIKLSDVMLVGQTNNIVVEKFIIPKPSHKLLRKYILLEEYSRAYKTGEDYVHSSNSQLQY